MSANGVVVVVDDIVVDLSLFLLSLMFCSMLPLLLVLLWLLFMLIVIDVAPV